jgi:hypothetical protein
LQSKLVGFDIINVKITSVSLSLRGYAIFIVTQGSLMHLACAQQRHCSQPSGDMPLALLLVGAAGAGTYTYFFPFNFLRNVSLFFSLKYSLSLIA